MSNKAVKEILGPCLAVGSSSISSTTPYYYLANHETVPTKYLRDVLNCLDELYIVPLEQNEDTYAENMKKVQKIIDKIEKQGILSVKDAYKVFVV